MRASTILLGAALAVATLGDAADAGAQALGRGAGLAPQYVGYRLDLPDGERRITQLAVPVAVAIPLGRRFGVDIATAWASARYDSAGVGGRIEGLTDTQLRASWAAVGDNVVVTAGLNLPTGQSSVDLMTQGAAAGQIGNDFLAFPISNMGTGFAGTGGVALARAMRGWNVGGGASFRRMVAYEPFDPIPGYERVRFQPGDEYRVRVGADRAVRSGQAAVGLTWFGFGDDADGASTYGSGDRVLAQGAWSAPFRGVDLHASAWSLYRASGEQAGNVRAPAENIANLALATGIHLGRHTLEPNVELRSWTRDGNRAGRMALPGIRARFDVGPVMVMPGVSYALGSVSTAGLRGWRAAVGVRR